MRVDLFDFDLPEERIALRPAEPRDSAKMLVVKPGEGLSDRTVREYVNEIWKTPTVPIRLLSQKDLTTTP